MPFDRCEVLGEGLEVPRDAGVQRRRVHVFDLLQRVRHQLAIGRARRRDRKAAVAGDDGGHAVEARRCQCRIPEDLGVVVGVDVDEAGGDDVTAGIDDVIAAQVRTDLDDAPTGDGDVGAVTGCAGAVDDGATLHDGRSTCDVGHCASPSTILERTHANGVGAGDAILEEPRRLADSSAACRWSRCDPHPSVKSLAMLLSNAT